MTGVLCSEIIRVLREPLPERAAYSRHRLTVTGKSASGKDIGVYRLRGGDRRILFTARGNSDLRGAP